MNPENIMSNFHTKLSTTIKSFKLPIKTWFNKSIQQMGNKVGAFFIPSSVARSAHGQRWSRKNAMAQSRQSADKLKT